MIFLLLLLLLHRYTELSPAPVTQSPYTTQLPLVDLLSLNIEYSYTFYYIHRTNADSHYLGCSRSTNVDEINEIIAMIDRYNYGVIPPAPRITIPPSLLIDIARAQPGEVVRSRGYLPFMTD